MSYRDSITKSYSFDYSKDYRKAYKGVFHIAFSDVNDNLYLPLEDKEPLDVALKFYHDYVLTRPFYPCYEGDCLILKKSDDPLVLEQILGLPTSLFEMLDLSKDILSQLSFKEDLSILKKDAYQHFITEKDRKWFIDDFKMFCLKNGVYFLMDETKPFLYGNNNLPVFFDESRMSGRLLDIYRHSDAETLSIFYMREDYDAAFLSMMKEFDQFSLARRVDFFVNGDADPEFLGINSDREFERKYCNILKKQIVAIVNTLYDKYCDEVIHAPSRKRSFLSVEKIKDGEKSLYVASSFFADMFSLDGVNYYFTEEKREEILHLTSLLFSESKEKDPLALYTRLSFPIYGYQSVRDLKDFTVEEFVSHLPFQHFDFKNSSFRAPKRFNEFYTYAAGTYIHNVVFSFRFLGADGIFVNPYYAYAFPNNQRPFTFQVLPVKRTGLLYSLFDSDHYSLFEDAYPFYLYKTKQDFSIKLENAIQQIDEVSGYQACKLFFSLAKNRSLHDIVLSLLQRLNLSSLMSSELEDLFAVVLLLPMVHAENIFHFNSIQQNDLESLIILNDVHEKEESYEPYLPYPYVYQGLSYYSFRPSYFSKPCLCKCSKDAIKAEILFYESRRNPSDSKFDEKLIDHLSLPQDIKNTLVPGKDLLSQIHFVPHICHRCQNTMPKNHLSIDDNVLDPKNAMLSYIIQNGARNGVFVRKMFSSDRYQDVMYSGSYSSFLNFDRTKVQDFLLPYVDVDGRDILSLIMMINMSDGLYSDFVIPCIDYCQELGINEKECQQKLFKNPNPERLMREDFSQRLLNFYQLIGLAYCFCVSEDIIPFTNHTFTLGYDYNVRLPYPYIILGPRFNGYSETCAPKGIDEIYFCECDREGILNSIRCFYDFYEGKISNRQMLTPIILTMAGLPYHLIHAVKDFSFDEHTPEEFVNLLSFKYDICRRCNNIAHGALAVNPFYKEFAFSSDMGAEYTFATGKMARDGFILLMDCSISEFKIKKGYRFNLDFNNDSYLPFVLFVDRKTPEPIYKVFHPSKEDIKEIVNSLNQEYSLGEEASAYALGLMLDQMEADPDVFFVLFKRLSGNDSFMDCLTDCFPDFERVREEFLDPVFQVILFVAHALYEKLIDGYIKDELHIGR